MGEKLNSKAVLMDFWAPWCGPCQKLKPVLEKLQKDYGDKLKVTKVNVDEHPELALKYQVMALPTLLLAKDDKEVTRIVGVRSYREIKEEIDRKL